MKLVYNIIMSQKYHAITKYHIIVWAHVTIANSNMKIKKN